MVFLTEDHKLYGVGNAGGGALQQYDSFDWEMYLNGEHYAISTPYLLMEDVTYAVCGRDDVVALKEDGTVWTWGTVYINGGYQSSDVYFIEKPKQILKTQWLLPVAGFIMQHCFGRNSLDMGIQQCGKLRYCRSDCDRRACLRCRKCGNGLDRRSGTGSNL